MNVFLKWLGYDGYLCTLLGVCEVLSSSISSWNGQYTMPLKGKSCIIHITVVFYSIRTYNNVLKSFKAYMSVVSSRSSHMASNLVLATGLPRQNLLAHPHMEAGVGLNPSDMVLGCMERPDILC